ncbi:hypothetical protein Tco_1417640 [Tanacetum coccineum]
MTDKLVLVKEKPKAVEIVKKSYWIFGVNPLEFELGDRVLLKVTPWKGVVCFGKKGKLAPWMRFPKGGDTVTAVSLSRCFHSGEKGNNDMSEAKLFQY